MQYQDNDYATDNDTAPWTAAPTTEPAPIVTTTNSAQMMPLPVNTPIITSNTPTNNISEVMVLGSLIQSIQQAQTRQMYVLRDIDVRLTHLEDAPRYTAPPPPAAVSYERATWWAMWGLLMLILGGALTIVIMLILLNVQFK